MVTEFNVSIIVDDENTCVDMIVKYLDRLVKSEESNADAALASSAEEENIVTPENIEGSDIPIEE